MLPQLIQCIAAFAVFTQASASTVPRQLSYGKIVGYEPNSDVSQHNLLDKDQKEMEAYLKTPDFAKAKAIYEGGAHSGAYARITVNKLPGAVEQASAVVQESNAAAAGYVKAAKGAGVTSVDLTYTSTCVDNSASTDYSTAACFDTRGAMTIAGTMNIGVPTAVANRYRTLAGFSTAAGTRMAGQTPPHVTFEKFKAYYGHSDYGHRYVTAALDGSGIFAGKDNAARVEGAKKGSAYLNVWMYTIREMEDAIADCKADCVACNDDPVHAWDEAVAFYAGSLEGSVHAWSEGVGPGKMLYALAEKRCHNFMTCSGETAAGSKVSAVNKEIMTLFAQGQAKLLQSKCSEVPTIRDSIIKHMSVPMIQGALRYAYKVDKLQLGSKEKAEGAVFAAAILPMVHSCSPTAATTIADNMNIDSTVPMKDGFAAVKSAFESTYSCLGVTCSQVGGLILTGSLYYEGASPCSGVQNQETTSNRAPDNGPTDITVISVVVSLLTLAAQ
jgi:hypothetical protein